MLGRCSVRSQPQAFRLVLQPDEYERLLAQKDELIAALTDEVNACHTFDKKRHGGLIYRLFDEDNNELNANGHPSRKIGKLYHRRGLKFRAQAYRNFFVNNRKLTYKAYILVSVDEGNLNEFE